MSDTFENAESNQDTKNFSKRYGGSLAIAGVCGAAALLLARSGTS